MIFGRDRIALPPRNPPMSSEVAASLFATVVTLLVASPALVSGIREWLARNRQVYKYVYVKAVHLTSRADGGPPVYVAHVKRLGEAAEVPVYDEYHYFRLNVFRRAQTGCCVTDRSSGVVDLQILHPFTRTLTFADEGAERVPGVISQEVEGESSVLFTRTIYYNGLQKGNEDIAMKLELDTDEARLIVDFSSIPNFRDILGRGAIPRGSRRTGKGAPEPLGVEELSPGIYSLMIRDGKKGDVMRMDFAFAWSSANACVPAGR